ncbi:MAG: hypothetical protein JF593_05640 [Novosphingobium sp.]|nr:hypothetical protein [Novosphingobium sp.]
MLMMATAEMAPDFVRGDDTGLAIPAHTDALREAGAAFLTAAFRAFGAIGSDNAVRRITRWEEVRAGNSGHKLALSVEYERPDAALDTELFVKFSRDFADPFRDRRRHELQAEVRLAELSRHSAFPVTVAKPYFADFHQASGTGLLIMRSIRFGEGGIEPRHVKCMDHMLPNALECYRATVTALARLAAAHRAGRLSPDVERLFPYDRPAATADLSWTWDVASLRAAIQRLRDFAARAPQLLPPAASDRAFLDRLERDALAFLHHEQAVRSFLHADPDLIALCHWNTNLDNAWFWRDAGGQLQCGLLDWGMVRQMNVAYGLWGGLSAADPTMLEQHLDELLVLFAAELAVNGGPRLELSELRLHFDLALALIGIALMLDLPRLIDERLPEALTARGPHDRLVCSDTVVHGFLTVSGNFLNLWARHDFGAALERMLMRARD